MTKPPERVVPLVLASASASRIRLARAAGLDFTARASGVDETALKAKLKNAGPEMLARALAVAKAEAVSRTEKQAFVIGADQVLCCAGKLYDKPGNMDEARRVLETLRGRSHDLYSAVALARDGQVEWQACDRARLVMRPFSTGFLESYLEAAGPDILGSVGCYHLEGRGVHLFEKIDGSYFTVLGLPLLPLLEELRRRGVLVS